MPKPSQKRTQKTSPKAGPKTSPKASQQKNVGTRRIDHVVVLMLENRSFDHIFGFRPGVAGLTGNESNLVDSTRPKSSTNPAIPVAKGAPFSFTAPSQGPGHSFADANTQLTGSKAGPSSTTPALNNGYVQQYVAELHSDHVSSPTNAQLAQVMQSFSPDQLPSINALAGAFTLCDHWFSEVPGPTQPNRLFMHAATSSGLVYNNWGKKFDCRTIYNSLQDAGCTWAVYWTDDNEVAEFNQVSHQAANFKDYATSFVADAKAGKLPNYTFIEPQFNSRTGAPGNSQHPPADARNGDRFIAEVYEAVRSNDAAWARTLLVVTYDEHGGFYDHVVPPSSGVPNPDGLSAPQPGDPSWVPPFSFDRLGVRVPAVLASPWLDAGVESRPLQHTSVLATVKRLFGLSSFLTKRDASATAFDDLFARRATPRTDTPMTLPRAVTPPAEAKANANGSSGADPSSGKLDATQQELAHGAHVLTSSASPSDEPLATTQHEASVQMQRRMTAYLKHRQRESRQRGRFEITTTARGGYLWTLIGANGKPLAKAAAGYATRAAARAAATALSGAAHGAGIDAGNTSSSTKRAPPSSAKGRRGR